MSEEERAVIEELIEECYNALEGVWEIVNNEEDIDIRRDWYKQATYLESIISDLEAQI